MPFKSKKQQRWMFVNDPEMALEWAHKTKNIKNLPEKVKKKKKKKTKKQAAIETRLALLTKLINS